MLLDHDVVRDVVHDCAVAADREPAKPVAAGDGRTVAAAEQ